MKPLIIRSGRKRRPSARATTKMRIGSRLERISARPRTNWWLAAPLVVTSSRTIGLLKARITLAMSTPSGMVRMPDMMPSAMYLWSRLSSMARPMGIEKTMVAPPMKPVISAITRASLLAASAEAS
ncbi:hypothetical protein D9M71_789750 [compost metagenome]